MPLLSVVAVAADKVAPLLLTGSVKLTVTPPAGADPLVTVAVMMLTCPAVTEVAEAPIDTAYVVVADPVLVIAAELDMLPTAARTVSETVCVGLFEPAV